MKCLLKRSEMFMYVYSFNCLELHKFTLDVVTKAASHSWPQRIHGILRALNALVCDII